MKRGTGDKAGGPGIKRRDRETSDSGGRPRWDSPPPRRRPLEKLRFYGCSPPGKEPGRPPRRLNPRCRCFSRRFSEEGTTERTGKGPGTPKVRSPSLLPSPGSVLESQRASVAVCGIQSPAVLCHCRSSLLEPLGSTWRNHSLE